MTPTLGRHPAIRELGVAWLHLGVLWAFAFAQPLFEILADSPEFFVARRNTAGDIVVFACALILIPPTVLAAVEAFFARLPAVRRALHLTFVAILAAAFALQVLTDVVGAPAAVPIALAVLIGTAIAVAYGRTTGVSVALTVLSPAPLLLLGYFLLLSPVSNLVLPRTANTGPGARGGNGAPVVMVVFDEFAGASLLDAHHRIDRTRFPNFARLAGDATWYRNATTVAERTERAVPALLTGRLPGPHALPIAAEQPHNLFTFLGDRYEFHVIEPATDLCPQRLCGRETRPSTDSRLSSLVSDLSVVSLHLLLPEGLSGGLPPIDRTFGDFRGQGRDRPARKSRRPATDLPAQALLSRTSSFDAFLRDLGTGRKSRSLHFIHVALPHRPWQYLPDGREYRKVNDGVLTGPHNPEDPALARQALQQYMLQTVYVDRLLGRLLARLRALGLYDRAAVVVVADHGITFEPGADPRLAIPAERLDEIGGVPMLIKGPGQRQGRVEDANIHTTDVLPKLAGELGTSVPWKTFKSGDVAVKTILDSTSRLSFPRWVQLRNAAAKRIADSFGPGVEGLYQSGVDGELVGRRIGGFQAGAPSSERAELDTFGELQQVDLEATPLPVDVSGRIEGSAHAGERLAIALNGTVAATTHSYAAGNRIVLDALVSPAALRAGSNAVAVLAIRDGPSGPELRPLRTAQPRKYDLVDRGGQQVIDTPDGRAITVAEGAVRGYLGLVQQEGGTGGSLTVAGWAVGRGGDPADRLVLFEGDRFLAATRPAFDRPDVAKQLGAAALKSGFSIVVPSAGIYGQGLRVVAIAGDRASELPRGAN